MTSFIHKISKFQGWFPIKISSMGPRCAPTLILAFLQLSNSQSKMPILKSSWHLTACRYHASFFVKQDRNGEFLEFFGNSRGFPFFECQPLKAWHSLHLGTERYMTKPDGATISSVRPMQVPRRSVQRWICNTFPVGTPRSQIRVVGLF